MSYIEPQSQVRLLSNVPLSNTYEHQMTFPDISHQVAYFNSKITTVAGVTMDFDDFVFVREEVAIKVPAEYTLTRQCNYMMYKNNNYSSKWFYAFITKVEYVNPNTSKIYFELDVFQTWQHYMVLKDSFVIREHYPRWNADGTPVVNTQPEDLDYGTKYETVHCRQWVPYNNIFFLIVVTKNPMHLNSVYTPTPIYNGGITPLSYYVHPFKMDGTLPLVTWGGQSQSINTIKFVLQSLFRQSTAVNNVVSMYITDYTGVNHSYLGNTIDFPTDYFDPVIVAETGNQSPAGAGQYTTFYLKQKHNYSVREENLGDKYVGFKYVKESKLLMYPYSVMYLSDLKGNQVEIKPEYINSKDLTICVRGSMGVSNKVAYFVESYLQDPSLLNSDELAMENAIVNNNTNDVPILTDLLSAYIQGHKNVIENTRANVLFNTKTNIARNVLSGIGSAINRDVGGVLQAGMNIYQGTENSLNKIKQETAKQQDLENIPPALTKMGGNTAFEYGNDNKGVYIIRKMITSEYRNKLEKYFHWYGVKVNQLKTPNIFSREHFNFIQTIGCTIQGDIPMKDKIRLQNMFDNGVTFWHGDWVGDYSLVNNEVQA